MKRPHGIPNGGEFRLPEPGLYLVLVCDPYEEPAYDDICYLCDGDHLDGFVGRLHDEGFPPEDIRVVSCAVNGRIDMGWTAETHSVRYSMMLDTPLRLHGWSEQWVRFPRGHDRSWRNCGKSGVKSCSLSLDG